VSNMQGLEDGLKEMLSAVTKRIRSADQGSRAEALRDAQEVFAYVAGVIDKAGFNSRRKKRLGVAQQRLLQVFERLTPVFGVIEEDAEDFPEDEPPSVFEEKKLPPLPPPPPSGPLSVADRRKLIENEQAKLSKQAESIIGRVGKGKPIDKFTDEDQQRLLADPEYQRLQEESARLSTMKQLPEPPDIRPRSGADVAPPVVTLPQGEGADARDARDAIQIHMAALQNAWVSTADGVSGRRLQEDQSALIDSVIADVLRSRSERAVASFTASELPRFAGPIVRTAHEVGYNLRDRRVIDALAGISIAMTTAGSTSLMGSRQGTTGGAGVDTSKKGS
jgi:hypothetical protein